MTYIHCVAYNGTQQRPNKGSLVVLKSELSEVVKKTTLYNVNKHTTSSSQHSEPICDKGQLPLLSATVWLSVASIRSPQPSLPWTEPQSDSQQVPSV